MDIVIFNVFHSKVTKLRNFNAEINTLDTKDLFDIYERLARDALDTEKSEQTLEMMISLLLIRSQDAHGGLQIPKNS